VVEWRRRKRCFIELWYCVCRFYLKDTPKMIDEEDIDDLPSFFASKTHVPEGVSSLIGELEVSISCPT
jgi:hypothetical protein